jgi:hypothetical protein
MGETNEPRDAGAKLTSGAAVGKVIHTDAMIPPDIIQGLRDAGMDDDAISTTIDIARAIKVEPVEFCKDTLRWLGERDKPFTVPPHSGELAEFEQEILGRIIAGEHQPIDISDEEGD